MNPYLAAALKLHQYLVDRHWDGCALVGPDPGVRFNYRIGRFIKSYLPLTTWNDDLRYLQGQGYWVLANWDLYGRTHDSFYRDIALNCTDDVATRQRSDGAWDYPNPEWTGRVATVEGIWASLGLLETYRWTGDESYLRAVLQWHTFLIEKIGFRHRGGELAINYFAGRVGGRVPNNSTDALRFLAELAQVTGQRFPLQPCAGLLEFLRRAQSATGELPYAVDGDRPRPHFQCYQYNAFQCLGLMRYYELTADASAIPIIRRVLAFLGTGVASDGRVFYACGNTHRFVTYHAAVVGAAFATARRLGIGSDDVLANRTLDSVLRLQNRDGSCPYSCGDYRLLSDRRSYPRYLAMILVHLLTMAQRDVAEFETRYRPVAAAVADSVRYQDSGRTAGTLRGERDSSASVPRPVVSDRSM